MSRVAASPAAGGRRRRGFEVQIHPADHSRRVRTLAWGRAAWSAWALLALGYLTFLAAALALAPEVLRALAGGEDYPAVTGERARQGERLQGLVRRLDELARRGEAVDLDLRQVEAAYGVPEPRPAAAARRPPPGAAEAPESIYSAAIERGERRRARLGAVLDQAGRRLGDIQGYEKAHPEQVRATPSACPLAGRDFVLVSPFARRRNPFTHELAFHTGLDFAAPAGTPARAPADGRVAFAGRFSPSQASGWWRLGNLIILVHGDRFATVFGHCAELKVRSGQAVRQGEVVATVGASGWATSPQLHYEVWRRAASGAAVPVDPRLFILDRRWPNAEQLVAGGPAPRPSEYDPLPVGWDRR